MLGLVFLLRKFKLAKYASNKHIKIVNIVPIGAKERIILLEVNKTILLVGATPSHIETLYVFNELDPAISQSEFIADVDANQKNTFMEKLAALTK